MVLLLSCLMSSILLLLSCLRLLSLPHDHYYQHFSLYTTMCSLYSSLLAMGLLAGLSSLSLLVLTCLSLPPCLPSLERQVQLGLGSRGSRLGKESGESRLSKESREIREHKTGVNGEGEERQEEGGQLAV